MNKRKILYISMASIIVIIMIWGFQKYENIKNPHQAFQKDLQQQKKTVEEKTVEEKSVFNKNTINILLLGVDSSDVREAKKMGYRSDSLMLTSINLDTKEVKILSIPRDTYTDVPGNKNKDKINHAMAFGGGPRSKGNKYAVEAVEGLLGINVHYYVTMDLDIVRDIVNAIGGVTVDVERAMGSGTSRLEKGEQVLSGDQALIYLSNRNAPTGDFARIRQQQKFMISLFEQTKERGSFADIPILYLKMQNKVFTDLKVDQIGALALLLKDIKSEDIQAFTLTGSSKRINGIYYIEIDRNHMEEIIKEHF